MIILFDLDGTLIDSTDAIVSTFHYSFKKHNSPLHVEDEDIKALIGYPLDIMYAELGVDKDEVWDYVATYKEEYRKISTIKTTLLPNAVESVKKASEFAELGIVTTKTGKYSKILMEHFDLMKYFKVLIGREDVEHPKPHEEPILKALQSFDARSKDDVWMIGDTKLDLLSAKNAGINSIGVLCGYSDELSLKKFSNVILNDSLEAVKFLQNRKK
jgi:phosphoglycolate phosphatase